MSSNKAERHQSTQKATVETKHRGLQEEQTNGRLNQSKVLIRSKTNKGALRAKVHVREDFTSTACNNSRHKSPQLQFVLRSNVFYFTDLEIQRLKNVSWT